MVVANMRDAKAHLSRLVERALAGEDGVISRRGRPAVRLVPVMSDAVERRFGLAAGRIWISDDFDAPRPDDLLAAFES